MKYVIEHMEPSINDWVRCEYIRIIQTCGAKNLLFSKYCYNKSLILCHPKIN